MIEDASGESGDDAQAEQRLVDAEVRASMRSWTEAAAGTPEPNAPGAQAASDRRDRDLREREASVYVRERAADAVETAAAMTEAARNLRHASLDKRKARLEARLGQH